MKIINYLKIALFVKKKKKKKPVKVFLGCTRLEYSLVPSWIVCSRILVDAHGSQSIKAFFSFGILKVGLYSL
jgi:hypothetical protein